MRALAALLVLLPVLAAAQPDPTPTAATDPFGWGWGVGAGMSNNLVGRIIVEPGDAFIDANQEVVVTRFQNVRPRMLLESHFTWKLPFFGDSVALGPAMFVQPGGDGLFDAAGGGLMLELGDDDTSFNIIIGALLDFEVSVLHDDYQPRMTAPTDSIVFVQREELQLFVGFAIGR